ncbi:MAG: hypothetical protein ACI9H6_000564 [Patiriisocius sp.]|jgi:uncharacterized protein
MDEIFIPVADKVKSVLEVESTGHDYYHAERVLNNALHIQEMEGVGDRYIIGVSALIHDVCRPWEKETGKSHFGDEALERIREMLTGIVEKEAIQDVLEVVRFHDIYDWDKPQEKSTELQIVQDADNLDALGALGIGRTFAFGGALGLNMYVPGENHDFDKEFVEDPNHRTSTIAHFYEKLLKLRENMNTSTGIELGNIRHARMTQFLDDFFEEWNGLYDTN